MFPVRFRLELSLFSSSRNSVLVVVVSSRTEPYDDVDDVTSFSALDVVEIKDVLVIVVFVVGAGRR